MYFSFTEKFPHNKQTAKSLETQQQHKMLTKIRGFIFPALAFAAFCYIFGKTQAIHVLEPADVDVGDEGDICQCGPRCDGYVEEHSCAR
jgi:hypothetical protein